MTSRATPIHIFKAGRHTAQSGQSIQFGEPDLQAVASAYDPARHEAPLVVGHPKHDLPAYGWVAGLQYSDGSGDQDAGLWALPAQVNPDFADLVAAGAFKKISAAFYSPGAPNNPTPGHYYLRHVGFLGAQPPAVKGLRNPAFADDEDGVVTVEFGDPTAFQTQQKESTVTEEEAARLRAENEQLKARAAQLVADQAHAANVAFCDGLIADGRLLPAAKAVVVATLDHLAGQEKAVEFGEGDQKAPLIDSLKTTLQAAPKAVAFGEHATTDNAAQGADAGSKTPDADDAAFAESADPERLQQHKAIKAHMAQHKVDYATAARAVIR